jgi:AcrR family transcriptional regulator
MCERGCRAGVRGHRRAVQSDETHWSLPLTSQIMYVSIHDMRTGRNRGLSPRALSPRERMVVSAALLIRERGAQPTAIADVLEHSGAPRGSAYHYFPGGRTQLLCEAVDYASEYVAAQIANAARGLDVVDALIEGYKEQLIRTDYRAGCPVVAVTVEAGDADEPDHVSPLIARAAAAFAHWTELLARRLVADGIAETRAEELAMLGTAAIEGAIILARASHDLKPLDIVHRQLRSLLQAETSEGKPRDDQ